MEYRHVTNLFLVGTGGFLGAVNKNITLADRKWQCSDCGTNHDRDVNAAINIKKFALNKQNLIGI
ncbi:putative transposase-like DNA-binding protein [Methanohalophilus euhalobius]|jgi:putative transposase|uniref:Putative transposase-like DNA-binding protein n=1 Tax=Methanohalophilus euhalobius TaxID=51203 RepID=A0A315BAA8_9EURY|nr:putative transposase-like DNA-binding protein [Methanohalophilus euhalobius]